MMSLYDYLRAGHVKRWHIVNTAISQSLAEHSYLVAMIAMHLHSELEPDQIEDIQATAIYALFHDITEIRTGDIPTPAKKFMRETGSVNRSTFEHLDAILFPKLPFTRGGEPTDITAMCVKMADVIEAAHWIRENGLGKHAEIVAENCFKKVKNLVDEYELFGDYSWYGPVNKILMALGMPYILREERLSPP